ncbi:MAG: phage holin family protein [Mucilaginibacter sp.]|nr:phage holin family protein [Mucilaginibacter sp.]
MAANKYSPPPITDQFKEYVKTRFLLTKYKAIEKGTFMASEIIVGLMIIVCILLFFLFVGITLACLLTQLMSSSWAGFGCIMILYLIIGVSSLIFKKRVKLFAINMLIKRMKNG